MAAELSRIPGVRVDLVRGGLGEFSVDLDGERIVATNRLWYPNVSKVLGALKERLLRP